MNYDLTHCPFCSASLTTRSGSFNDTRCTNMNGCNYRIELYHNYEDNNPTNIDYDAYVVINDVRYVFTSTVYKNGKCISKLNDFNGLDLISVETFTEPTIEAVEAMAQRLHKLLAFS